MKIRGARDLSVPVALALLGAVMCAGSLWMHWFEIDTAAFQRWMETSPLLAGARAQSSMSPEQMHAALGTTLDAAMRHVGGRFNGIHVLKISSVGLQLLAAALVFGAVARFMNQGTSRAQLAVELAAAGVPLAFRPVWAFTHLPDEELSAYLGSHESFLQPGLGAYVAMAGAIMILVAAFVAQRVSAAGADAAEALEQSQAEVAARTGGGGFPTPATPAAAPTMGNGPFVPGGAYPATAVPAAPTAFVPGGPAVAVACDPTPTAQPPMAPPAFTPPAQPPMAPPAYTPPAQPPMAPPAYTPAAYAPPGAAAHLAPAAAPSPMPAAPPRAAGGTPTQPSKSVAPPGFSA